MRMSRAAIGLDRQRRSECRRPASWPAARGVALGRRLALTGTGSWAYTFPLSHIRQHSSLLLRTNPPGHHDLMKAHSGNDSGTPSD